MNQENAIDRKDLKIQALLEANARLTDENADLRVELTLSTFNNSQLEEKIRGLSGDAEVEEDTTATDDSN